MTCRKKVGAIQLLAGDNRNPSNGCVSVWSNLHTRNIGLLTVKIATKIAAARQPDRVVVARGKVLPH